MRPSICRINSPLGLAPEFSHWRSLLPVSSVGTMYCPSKMPVRSLDEVAMWLSMERSSTTVNS